MKIIFLGTNGWYDTKTGNTTCTLLQTKQYSIILDAGNGIYKLDKYADFKKPAFLFLSHFHLDHIAGLHILNKFRFKSGLNIFCQKGGKKILNYLIKQPFTDSIANLPYAVKVIELAEGKHLLPFLVKVKSLIHSAPCLGYRFEIENKKIAYCTDTGVCQNLRELAKDADLLISECTLKSGQKTDHWPHLNPETVAKVAKEAKAKKLILTHFDANIYKTLRERKDAKKIAKTIFKNTAVAFDEFKVNL